MRLGEARNPGPVTHERDRTAEERIAHQSVSTKRDTPAKQTAPPAPAPPPMPHARRPTPTRVRQQQQECLRCANTTVQLVSSVTQSGRGGAIAAATAKEILPPVTSMSVIPFWTVDNLDTRMQHPSASPLLLSSLPVPMTAHTRTAPLGTKVQLLANLRRNAAAWGERLEGNHQWSSVLRHALPISLPPAAC